jgi:signal transduction histidine kinase
VVLAGGKVPAFEGDQARLAQLVENLISNAVKFSSKGGRIEVRTFAADRQIVLEVADSGIGVPAAQQAHVFEPFFRSTNATERAIQGTGLGLAIAKVIAEAHGGSIVCESEEAEGTTVRIALPRAREAPEMNARHADVA